MVNKTSADVQALDMHDDKMVHVEVRNLRLFNSGAFSNVYRGDLQLPEGKEAAIVIKKTWCSKEGEKENNTEISILKILNRMNHKNTVKLLYVFSTDYADSTCFSLVFEFLPVNLYQYMKENDRKMAIVETKMFVWQLFRGLHHLERALIIHRDIKPQNILIEPESGLLKIGDFGSSCIDPKIPQPSYHVTRYYRPPELLLGSKIYGVEVDIWSGGCVFSELLGARITFPGRNTAHQLELIMNTFGVPTLDEVTIMKVSVNKYREAKKNFTGKKSIPLKKLLSITSGQCPFEGVQLVQRILQYNPHNRLHGLELLRDPFFDELWDKKTLRPNGRPIECLSLKDRVEVDCGDKSMTGFVDLTHE